MTRTRLVAVALLLCPLVAGAGAWADVTGSETRAYTAGLAGFVEPDCESIEPAAGGACFAVPPGTHAVSIRVDDALGLTVGGTFSFFDADGNDRGGGGFSCGRFDGIAVPDGITRLEVTVGHLSSVPPRCAASAAGTITVTYDNEYPDGWSLPEDPSAAG